MLVQSRSSKGRFAFIWELRRLWKPPQHPSKGRNPVQIDRPAVLRRAKARCWVTWTRSCPSDLKLTLPCLTLISFTRPFNKRQWRQQRGEMSLTVNPSNCAHSHYVHATGVQKTHRNPENPQIAIWIWIELSLDSFNVIPLSLICNFPWLEIYRQDESKEKQFIWWPDITVYGHSSNLHNRCCQEKIHGCKVSRFAND